MDPLKAAAATAVCLALFWLAFRLTRRLVDMAIAAGHAEEHRRLEQEAAEAAAAAGAPPPASSVSATAARFAVNGDPSAAAAPGARRAAIGIVPGAPAE